MLTEENLFHKSLLTIAASSGNKDCFKTVLAAVQMGITPDQV